MLLAFVILGWAWSRPRLSLALSSHSAAHVGAHYSSNIFLFYQESLPGSELSPNEQTSGKFSDGADRK